MTAKDHKAAITETSPKFEARHSIWAQAALGADFFVKHALVVTWTLCSFYWQMFTILLLLLLLQTLLLVAV